MRLAGLGELLRKPAGTVTLKGIVQIDAAYAVKEGGRILSHDGGTIISHDGGTIIKQAEDGREIDAVYRHDPRQLRPKDSHLTSPGHQLLTTTYGDLDYLGTIDDDQTYEDLLAETTTEWAPWYVIPADRKWFTRISVARIIREALEEINPQFPVLSKTQRAELETARKMLEQEDGKE